MMGKRIAMLLALAAALLVPLSGRAATGWMEVHVTGLPSNDHARIRVLYQNSKGDYRHAEQIARSGGSVSFPLGSSAHNLDIVAFSESHAKEAVRLRYATLPADVVINFNH